MPEFECSVCAKKFMIPDEVLAKYPNWTPKYCRRHSPRKKNSASAAAGGASASAERDFTLAEVIENFSDGPTDGLFTDGSARPNPGPGGWAAVLVSGGEVTEKRYGHEQNTTNNRMELTALIEGLKLLDPEREMTVYSDSELCVNILTKWAAGWEKRGWKRKTGPIMNLELVQEAYQLFLERPRIELKWIKAHNGWLWNEYADSLASSWTRDEL